MDKGNPPFFSWLIGSQALQKECPGSAAIRQILCFRTTKANKVKKNNEWCIIYECLLSEVPLLVYFCHLWSKRGCCQNHPDVFPHSPPPPNTWDDQNTHSISDTLDEIFSVILMASELFRGWKGLGREALTMRRIIWSSRFCKPLGGNDFPPRMMVCCSHRGAQADLTNWECQPRNRLGNVISSCLHSSASVILRALYIENSMGV